MMTDKHHSTEYQKGRELAQSYFHGLISDPRSVELCGYLGDVQMFGKVNEFNQNEMSNDFADMLQILIVSHLTRKAHAEISAFRSFVDQSTRCPG